MQLFRRIAHYQRQIFSRSRWTQVDADVVIVVIEGGLAKMRGRTLVRGHLKFYLKSKLQWPRQTIFLKKVTQKLIRMFCLLFLLVPFLADAQNIQSLVDAQYKDYVSAHPWLGIAVVLSPPPVVIS